MLGIPLRNRYSPIALDVGTDSVKMLQLKRTGGELAVFACGRWRVPQELRDDPKRRYESTVSAVVELLRKQKFHGRKVVTALSCEQIAIKNVRMTHLPSHELTEAIKWEACERFNFEIAPDRLKYLCAGEIRQGNDMQDEIIMLAVSEETIDRHLAMLDEMNLYPGHIEVQPIAIFRVFDRLLRRDSDRETVSVILDIGTEFTRVVVARGRRIVFIKSISMGGKHLTAAVGRQLNLSFEEAAEIRSMIMTEQDETNVSDKPNESDQGDSTVSKSVAWTVHDAVRGEVEALAREINLCLRYCSVTFRGLRTESITVTGGQAYDPSVIKFLSEQLGSECFPAHPLRGINVSGAMFEGNRRGMLPEWALCVGLAMKNLDIDKTISEADDGQHRLSA